MSRLVSSLTLLIARVLSSVAAAAAQDAATDVETLRGLIQQTAKEPRTSPQDGSRTCIVLDRYGNWLQFSTPR